MQIVQGDVFCCKVEKIPEMAKKEKHLILAEGEATGHFHKVSEGNAVLYTIPDSVDKFLEVLSDNATITHEEHKPITLSKGIYKVGIVQEYDYDAEEIRQVRD
jgi:hypothetical protein